MLKRREGDWKRKFDEGGEKGSRWRTGFNAISMFKPEDCITEPDYIIKSKGRETGRASIWS